MSDDHASAAISAYGGRLAEIAPTPNIDRLAVQGVRFRNAFVVNSICTPSRSSIWTGKYSHINGVYTFSGLDQSQPTLPKYMQAHGYQTGFVGKYHLHTNPVGFDHWSILPGQGKYFDTEFIEKGDEDPSGIVIRGKKTACKGWYSTDIITKKALDWFRNERDPEKPFFYSLHFKAPHDLWEYAPRYEGYLADVKIPEPLNLHDQGSGRSPILDRSEQTIGGPRPHTLFNEEIASMAPGKEKRSFVYQEYMKKYLRCVKGVDDAIGKVLDYLDESGLSENTIVIYSSDQGVFLGEHGLYDKRFIYEESIRIPLLARWPGVISEGQVRNEMLLNLDIPSTILDIANHYVPEDMQGRSFKPLLLGEYITDWRKAFYYRYYDTEFYTPPHIGIRTTEYKLIHYYRENQWEMFDMHTDPMEMFNLADDPAYSGRLKKLKDQLVQIQLEVGDRMDDIGANPRTGNPILDKMGATRGDGTLVIEE